MTNSFNWLRLVRDFAEPTMRIIIAPSLLLGVILIAVLAVYVWPTPYRYYTIHQGQSELSVKEHRFNGKVWVFGPTGWTRRYSDADLQNGTVDVSYLSESRCSFSGAEANCTVVNNSSQAVAIAAVWFTPKKTDNPIDKALKWEQCLVTLHPGSDHYVPPHSHGNMSGSAECLTKVGPNWDWSFFIVNGSRD
jgi:hypothetical protein